MDEPTTGSQRTCPTEDLLGNDIMKDIKLLHHFTDSSPIIQQMVQNWSLGLFLCSWYLRS